jgi:uncharacterized membrane protein YhhN
MIKFFFVVVTLYLTLMLIPHEPLLSIILKPLIVGSLIVWVRQKPFINPNNQRLLLMALTFSLAGDIFLMIPGGTTVLFKAGLISFLIAHLFYLSLFSKDLRIKECNSRILIGSTMVFLLYGSFFFVLIRTSLGSLLIPVVCYMLVILAMALVAINRNNRYPTTGYWFVALGAVLFVISDSILAVNKFYIPVRASGFLIMGTYSFAQYFIAKGIVDDQKAQSMNMNKGNKG